jgi:hypothetical protein
MTQTNTETHSQILDRAWKGLVEELWGGLNAIKDIGNPQEYQQSQLPRTLGSSQRLNHQPKSIHGQDVPPHALLLQLMCILDLHVNSLTTGAGAIPKNSCLSMEHTLHCPDSVGEDVPSLPQT